MARKPIEKIKCLLLKQERQGRSNRGIKTKIKKDKIENSNIADLNTNISMITLSVNAKTLQQTG